MCTVTGEQHGAPVSPCEGTRTVIRKDRKRRQVRFGENKEIVFEKAYGREDAKLIWYTGDEYSAIRYQIFKMIKRRNSSDGEEYHWRGFEHYVTFQTSRKQIRKFHSDSFLHFYRTLNVTEPVSAGMFAANNSADCLIRARELALMDEKEAFEIYRGPPQTEMDSNGGNSISAHEQQPNASTEKPETTSEPILPKGEPNVMCICRGDNMKASFLEDSTRSPRTSSSQIASVENEIFAPWTIPYRLALMFLPCGCWL